MTRVLSIALATATLWGCARSASPVPQPTKNATVPAPVASSSPSPAPAVTPMPVGGEVSAPVEVYRPGIRLTDLPAEYTLGLCILEIVVDQHGAVTVIRTLRPDPVPPSCRHWVEQIIHGVSAWRYKPAIYRGAPVPVYMTITVTHFPC